MADATRVSVNGAGGGMLGREARTQYGAMARMRWRMFMNGLRSIHGLLDLGATGIAWLFYSILWAGFGSWPLCCRLLVSITRIMAVFANPVLGHKLSLVDVPDAGGLISGAVRPGNSVALSGAFRVVLPSLFDLRLDGSFHDCGWALLFGRMAWNRHGTAGFVFVGDARAVGVRGLQHSAGARCLCLD